MKQISLPGFSFKGHATHGGDHAQGRRKRARPVDPKQAIHLVLRSSRAKGKWSLLHPQHCNAVESELARTANKWGVQVYRFANVGNHLHLLLRPRTRRAFQGFLREFSGKIAMRVTGAVKARGLKENAAGRHFWDHLAFTRIVRFGRDYESAKKYLVKNLFESMGIPMRRLLAQGYRLVTLYGEPPPTGFT